MLDARVASSAVKSSNITITAASGHLRLSSASISAKASSVTSHSTKAAVYSSLQSWMNRHAASLPRQTSTFAPAPASKPRNKSASGIEWSTIKILDILSECDSIDDEVAVFGRLDDQPPAAAQRDVLHDRKTPGAPLSVARRDVFALGDLLGQFDLEWFEVITKMNLGHSIHDCDLDRDLPRLLLLVWLVRLAGFVRLVRLIRLDQAADQDFPDNHHGVVLICVLKREDARFVLNRRLDPDGHTWTEFFCKLNYGVLDRQVARAIIRNLEWFLNPLPFIPGVPDRIFNGGQSLRKSGRQFFVRIAAELVEQRGA